MAITLDGTNGILSPDFEPSSSTTPTNGLFLPAANTVGLATGSTERLRIDSSGNLGIGTTSPLSAAGYTSVRINNATNGGLLELTSNNTRVLQIQVDSASATQITTVNNGSNPYLAFGTNSTERARIDSSGNLLVGTTSSVGAARFCVSADTTTQNPMTIANTRATAATDYALLFYRAGNMVGSIQTSLSATSYITSSDQRLKENIVDAPSALTSVNAIKVRSFDWKLDGSHQDYGYIAQELLEVAPEAVSAPADPDEMMGVDFGRLTPRLVKAIQELTARLEALEAK